MAEPRQLAYGPQAEDRDRLQPAVVGSARNGDATELPAAGRWRRRRDL